MSYWTHLRSREALAVFLSLFCARFFCFLSLTSTDQQFLQGVRQLPVLGFVILIVRSSLNSGIKLNHTIYIEKLKAIEGLLEL